MELFTFSLDCIWEYILIYWHVPLKGCILFCFAVCVFFIQIALLVYIIGNLDVHC